MKKYTITIRDNETKEEITIDCKLFILTANLKKEEEVMVSDVRISPGDYLDLTRLQLLSASHLHNAFVEANKPLIKEIIAKGNNQ